MQGKRPTISSLHGMVAAAHPLAAQAGAQMLAAGGNAFDAAVAVAAALGVVEPAMSGLAGMGVATCWIASEGRVRVLDFMGRVPVDFPAERFTSIGQLNRGALSCGVPSNLAGWAELIATHGRKSLGDALEPATALAQDGFPLLDHTVDAIQRTDNEAASQELFAEWRRTYVQAAGSVLRHPRGGADHLDLVWRAIRLAAGVRGRSELSGAAVGAVSSDESVAALRARVLDGRAIDGITEGYPDPNPPGPDREQTTSFSVADRTGNVICCTQTLGVSFGSGIVVPGTGVCLNDLHYFGDVDPGGANALRPGMPLGLPIAPSMATRAGKPVLALGTPGGYGICQTQAQVLVQHLDYGLPLQDAIDAPRARVWNGSAVLAESRIGEAAATLQARGHDIEQPDAWSIRIDRLARSMKDLQDIVHELKGKGVALRATEQPVDTGTAAGKAFLDMLDVLAEFETNLRRERQLESIKAAKVRGVYKGRKPSIDAAELRRLRDEEKLGPAAIARRLGIGRASVYRVLGKAREPA